MAKLLYRPFGILISLVSGIVASRLFHGLWARIDGDHEPPTARTETASTRRVIAARGLQAATAAMTATALDRAGAKAFRRVTGFWPGEHEPAPRES